MSEFTKIYYEMIDNERNIYEKADLYNQIRKSPKTFLDILEDPYSGENLTIKDNVINGKNEYEIFENVPNFTNSKINSKNWKNLNEQFLNYHRSLNVYTLINNAPINTFLSLDSGIGRLKNKKVLDVGGGTGHTLATFFQFPETIDYFLLDPNLRLLHDHFVRLYPKLTYLEISHILGQAEYLPIKKNSFDIVLSISAVDHLDDFNKFIKEAFRVLKNGGNFLISSHFDVPPSDQDKTKTINKIFSSSAFERLVRYLYYKSFKVGKDDHTIHLDNLKPLEKSIINAGFKIIKQVIYKRYFYFLCEK